MSRAPALACATALSVQAALCQDLRLPAIISDHMVLQRESACPIFGRARPGAVVSVEAGWGGKAAARAGTDGRFEVRIDTPGAGGPYELRIESLGERIVCSDVLVGEVWLASGQSNMEMSVEAANGTGPGEGLATGPNEMIRLFKVARQASLVPVEDVQGCWRKADEDSVRPFSAAAWFFARRVQRDLDVPVGVVASAFGGTPAQSWIGEEALKGFPDLLAARARRLSASGGRDDRSERVRTFWDRVGRSPASPDQDDSSWEPADLPARFSRCGLASFDGVVWFRRRFTLPEGMAKGRGEVWLELGPIDDMDEVWLDGEPIAGTKDLGHWAEPRRYRVPGRLLGPGDHVLAICVVDTGGEGGIAAGSCRLLRGSDAIPLASGFRFHPSEALGDLPPFPPLEAPLQSVGSSLFHGMIEPLIPFALRGFLWYQGESNRHDHAQYRRLFPALIAEWRRLWGLPEAPFYFVQIAPFAYPGDRGETAALRLAQAVALSVPGTGMVVTMDIGEEHDIHPKDKRTVGERLARLALARTYGMSIPCEGPSVRSIRLEGGVCRIAFDHARGLSGREALELFEVLEDDGQWRPARARIEGEEVLLKIGGPIRAVRYAARSYCRGDLRNGAGLPAAPFEAEVGR